MTTGSDDHCRRPNERPSARYGRLSNPIQQALREVGEPAFGPGIVFIERHQHANPAHPI